MQDIQGLKEEWEQVLTAFEKAVNLRKGALLVIGCSTSEIAGFPIGKSGSLEIAHILVDGLMKFKERHQINVAVQCCEHLNRALVVSRQFAEKKQLEIVNAWPQRHAGGALGTVFFEREKEAVLVETIRADYGIDLGLTLIGMHLKHVAVPVRLPMNHLGQAIFTAAKTRPKYIGGARAVYADQER